VRVCLQLSEYVWSASDKNVMTYQTFLAYMAMAAPLTCFFVKQTKRAGNGGRWTSAVLLPVCFFFFFFLVHPYPPAKPSCMMSSFSPLSKCVQTSSVTLHVLLPVFFVVVTLVSRIYATTKGSSPLLVLYSKPENRQIKI
jgi:hypothetical protein